MADSLKAATKLALFGAMAANLAVFYAAIKSDAILGADWVSILKDAQQAAPAGFGLVLVGILNAQISPNAKAQIIFARWNNPLPGSRAFTKHAATDPRIDVASLERAHGPLPTDPEQQNRLWYRLYKTVEDHPSVLQVHGEFLFARDYACLALMMAIALGAVGFIQIPSISTAWTYLGLLVLQFVLTWRAARAHGLRLVTTVLALKSSGKQPSRK
jgi:hypothetical protein